MTSSLPSSAALTTWIRAHPFSALAVTNSVLAASLLWVASEGKPVKWITHKLFQAILAAVPRSVMGAQLIQLRADVEKSVLGKSLEGRRIMTTLPAEGS